jgi:hypothetical protein
MVRPLQSGRSRSIIITLGAIAAIAIAGTSIALGAAHRHVVNPDTTVSYTATTTGPVVQGIQNGTGQGVEGLVGTAAGGIGMLGFATSLTNAEVALEGLAWGPSSVGLYGQGLKNSDTTHPTVGLLGTSTSGVGVEGQSLVSTGSGVYGVSSDGLSSGNLGIGGASGVLGTSSRGSFLSPGVDGESIVAGSEDTGGSFGLSGWAGGHQPVYGVLGYGSKNALYGILLGSGTSSTNSGVEGLDNGTFAFPDHNVGLLGESVWGAGALTEGGGTLPTRIGSSFTEGLYVVGGNSGTGTTYAVGQEVEAADSNTDAIFTFNVADGRFVDVVPSGDTLLLEGFNGGSGFTFDTSGNEVITGLITTAGACSGGCSSTRGHEGRVVTYAAQSSEPTVEDFGEGQLVAGTGRVAIDAAFARTIDANQRYMVFLTPEGDNRGLYVSQRTPTGFTVREAQGGASTLGFMYRIVAKRYGVVAARLPIIDANMQHNPQAGIRSQRVPQPMEPYAALVKAIGPQRAAQLLAQFRANNEQRVRMLKALPHSDMNGTLHLGATTVAPTNVHN